MSLTVLHELRGKWFPWGATERTWDGPCYCAVSDCPDCEKRANVASGICPSCEEHASSEESE